MGRAFCVFGAVRSSVEDLPLWAVIPNHCLLYTSHPMESLYVADSNDVDTGRQWGNPLLYRTGSKLLIVAPSKSPTLTVYEVPLNNDSSVASVSK